MGLGNESFVGREDRIQKLEVQLLGGCVTRGFPRMGFPATQHVPLARSRNCVIRDVPRAENRCIQPSARGIMGGEGHIQKAVAAQRENRFK